MKLINRNCLILRPQKPFFDWLKGLFKEAPMAELDEHSVYLIRELNSEADFNRWLSKNYQKLFEHELNNWYTEPSAWPQDRSLSLFKAWFELEFNSMVFDLERTKIEKE